MLSPHRRISPERLSLVALLMLFASQAALVGAVLPPWQDADSPTHFVLVRALALPDRSPEAVEALEADVLRSMARYRWWEPYEVQTPDPLPTTFAEMQFGRGTYAQPLYYVLGAGVLRMTNPRDTDTAYWHLRILSLLLSVVTLTMGWRGTRLMFGPHIALGATAVAALYPQFLLAGIAVNPNVLAAVWGAFAWWQVGRVVAHRPRLELSLLLIIIAAVAALFTKRSTIPFSIAAMIAAAVLFRQNSGQWSARRSFVVIGAVAVSLALAAAVAVVSQGGALMTYWSSIVKMLAARTWRLSEVFTYTLENIDNTWFIAGWHRYVAPEPWRVVARLLTFVGIGGALVRLVRPSPERPAVSIAWLMVAAQVFVVLAAGLWGFLVPHGRYAEPVLVPMALLLWLGVQRLLQPVAGQYAGVALVATLAIMDAGLLTNLLMPAYLPW